MPTVVLAGAGAALGSWALSSSDDKPSATAPETAEALPVPFPEIDFSPDKQTALRQAEDRLVEGCMRDKGITYRVPNGSWKPDVQSNPYGLLTKSAASADGYLLPEESEPSPDPELPDRENTALFGTEAHQKSIPLPLGGEIAVRTDSCYNTAQDQLYGKDWKALRHTFETLSYDVVTQVEKDSRFTAAQRSWAECLRSAHYPVTTLDAMAPHAVKVLESVHGDAKATATVRKDLRAMAVQDAACQNRARLAEAVTAAQKDARNGVLRGARSTDLAHLRELRRHALDTAHRMSLDHEGNDLH
ncbi:hypothetical protein FHS39_004586 [Streptomyces olivoverticillatus]|uniref:Uncharacterized protein n=1 Tax=Streptomyces olivoverticillatus TaxID=66427 RepID=A0A7W7LSA5_9ACTN|nr:hypothetical protein [Streptomyces olivoverticillatus]MBB4895508.1 hypothetical protein [Streptomyces olivoverticillatus]